MSIAGALASELAEALFLSWQETVRNDTDRRMAATSEVIFLVFIMMFFLV